MEIWKREKTNNKYTESATVEITKLHPQFEILTGKRMFICDALSRLDTEMNEDIHHIIPPTSYNILIQDIHSTIMNTWHKHYPSIK